MLKKLRNKKTAKKIWIILAALILPAFIFWGFGGVIKSRQESSYLGKIFGKKISQLEYKDAIGAVKNQAIIQFGDNFSEIQKYLNLESQAWDRLILLAEAKKRKIDVSDREVIELIENYPFFQRKGQFDNRVYSEMLQYVFRTQPRIFEEQSRQNLMLAKLYKQVSDGIGLKDEEVKEEYRKANEETSIYYIASLPSEFIKEITPNEEELKDYFSKNSIEFKQPLSFNLEYITLGSEDKARHVLSRISKKEDLQKVVKDNNLVIKETGLFGQTDLIPGIGWSPEILSLILKLKVGQFSPPILIDKSYYILRLKERREPYIPDYEMTKDKVKQGFIKNNSQRMAKDKIGNCLKTLKELYQLNPKSADFNKVAKEFGLKSDSTEVFKYGSYIEGIGASDNFWITAQRLKEGDFSEIIDLGASGFYIIKLKSKVLMDEKKFETEKKEFSQRLAIQKRQEYFTKFIEELKRKAQMF